MSSHLIPACADRPGDDPIFALNAEAERRAAKGEDVLNLTLGALTDDEGALAVMPSVFEAYRRVRPERAAAYAPISGPPEFLKAVVRDIFGASPMVEESIAAATPGGTGACHHAIVNFLERGQKLLTSSYYWGPYRIISEHTGRDFATFRMFDERGEFDLVSFEQSLVQIVREQGRALVILNTPCHNPTGYSLDERDWAGIVDACATASRSGSVTVLLDFAYAKFAAPDQIRWPQYVEKLKHHATVLFAWTASKAFAQYGSRVGACVALSEDPGERQRIKNALGYSCRGTWSNCNHLGMLAITELLTDDELRSKSELERQRLRRLLQERVEVFNELARLAGLSFPRYEGGFFVSVFTPDAECTSAHMRENGVFVVPLSGAVRVALCATPVDRVPRLIDALEKGVQAAQ